MKGRTWAALVGGLLMSSSASAASPGGPLGVGLGAGLGVSGISAKYYMGGTALQGVVGWRGLGQEEGSLGVGLDYLIELPDLASGDVLNVGANYGLGGTVGVGGAVGVGVSGVLGLELNFVPLPIDIVFEYRPGISLLPDLDAALVNFSSHIRYYF